MRNKLQNSVKLLNPKEEVELIKLIEKFEQHTGIDLGIVIAEKSDPYPAAKLRFSMVFSIATTFFLNLFFQFESPLWHPFFLGLSFTLGIFLAQIKSIFKSSLLAEETIREVRERAIVELHQLQEKLPGKSFFLLYISLTERRSEFLCTPDLKAKIHMSELEVDFQALMKDFSRSSFSQGLQNFGCSLEKKIIEKKLTVPDSTNLHLPNKIIYKN